MKKETKKYIIIGVVMLFALFAYYFFFYFPQEEKRYLSNQTKCQQEGSQLFESIKKEYGKDVVAEPNFRFIRGEGVCLYRGSFVGDGVANYFIRNVYTNETLASFAYVTKDGKTTTVTEDGNLKFIELEERYFPKK